MDWLTFISSVVKSLAWPATLVALLIIIRKDLPTLVRSLRKLKFKGVELEFGEATKQLAAEARNVLPPLTASASDRTIVVGSGRFTLKRGDSQFIRAENSKPLSSARGQILEAWLLLEDTARKLLSRKLGADPPSALFGTRLARELLRLGLMDEKEAAIFDDLRRLRNEAVHLSARSFTNQSVENYVDTALALIIRLDEVAQRL